jgi:hypothetical protein
MQSLVSVRGGRVILEVAIHLALPAGVFIFVKFLHVLIKQRLNFSRNSVRKFSEGALFCLCLAILTYTMASFSGFDTRPTRACAAARTGVSDPDAHRYSENLDIEIQSRPFPPSMTCVWPDGTKAQLVPFWLNAILLISLAGTLMLAALATRSSLHHSSASRRNSPY